MVPNLALRNFTNLRGLSSSQRRRFPMSNTKQDRSRVAGGQDHEVRYEANKEGVSKETVKDTVKEVGNSRKKVEAELDRKG